jgi:hypothetical protein
MRQLARGHAKFDISDHLFESSDNCGAPAINSNRRAKSINLLNI